MLGLEKSFGNSHNSLLCNIFEIIHLKRQEIAGIERDEWETREPEPELDENGCMSLRTKIIKYVIAHKSISLRTKIVKYVIAHKMDKISIFRKINLSSSTFQLYHAYSIKFH